MTQNPYAPPRAHVADAQEVEGPGVRPIQVARAVQMLWITLGLGVINTALQWQFLTASIPVEIALLTQLFTFGLLAWFTVKISAGRNWARITFLVMSLIGVPAILIHMPATFVRAPAAGIIGTIQFLLQCYAIYLIFSEPGRRWFRRPRPGP